MKLIKPILAAIENPVMDPALSKQINTNPQAFTNSVLQTVFSIFMLVGIIYFIWHFIMAGYHFISSQGDPKKIEEAKHSITYSAVGIFIVFAVFAILKLVGFIFGITGLDTLQLTLPALNV